jgi:hypothetical protein
MGTSTKLFARCDECNQPLIVRVNGEDYMVGCDSCQWGEEGSLSDYGTVEKLMVELEREFGKVK